MANGKTILVVDDDPAMLHLIPHALARTGCKIVTASSANEALAIAYKEPVHFLVTDLVMKGMDGLQLVQALRQRPACADLPAVILSGRWQTKYLAEAHPDETTILMIKPFSPIELTAHVHRLLKL